MELQGFHLLKILHIISHFSLIGIFVMFSRPLLHELLWLFLSLTIIEVFKFSNKSIISLPPLKINRKLIFAFYSKIYCNCCKTSLWQVLPNMLTKFLGSLDYNKTISSLILELWLHAQWLEEEFL